MLITQSFSGFLLIRCFYEEVVKTMFIDVNGVKLYYEVKGVGRPLIMIHGNSEDHTIFDVASEILKEYFTVYLLDSRDHGQSEKMSGELHYSDFADDVVAFLSALDLNDVLYYGFSDGGIIGLLVAIKTDRVSRMIISGTNLTPAGVVPWMKLMIKAMYLFTKDHKMKMMLTEPNIDPTCLKGIHIPTTVIVGEKDAVTYTETKEIADNIPNAKLIIVPKAGHGSYIVHKPDIAEMILKETGTK